MELLLLLLIFIFLKLMATISRENIGLLNDRISVKVDRDDYFPSFEKEIKQLSKQATLQGFRKGMVPMGLIKKMHGQSVFTREVIKSVEKELNTFLQSEKLELFSDPLPEGTEKVSIDMNKPEEYQFDFEIGIKPALDLKPVVEGLQLTKYRIMPDEKETEEEIERLRKKAGARKEKEAVAADEDILKVKFQPADAGETAEEDGEGKEKEEQMIVSYFSSEARKQLLGKKSGDSITLPLSGLFEEKELKWILKDWKLEAGAADGLYKMTIESAEEVIPRELNEEFFNEVFPGAGIKTEEDFRAEVEKNNAAYWEKESRRRLDHDVFEKLVHETPMELPEDFLKKMLKQDGEKVKTDEELSDVYPQFEHEMRWNLISGAIIRENNLDVTPDELRESFRNRLKGYFGLPEDSEEENERIEQFVTSMMQDQKSLEETYRNLLTNKLFDWLHDQAKLETKDVTPEEFANLPHNHHHHEH